MKGNTETRPARYVLQPTTSSPRPRQRNAETVWLMILVNDGEYSLPTVCVRQWLCDVAIQNSKRVSRATWL